MWENWYKIELEDGTEIDNLRLNGNNFISQEEITQDMFDGNLGTVKITIDGMIEEMHENMELIQIAQVGSEWWFILAEIPKATIEAEKLRSDVDYLAMMVDVSF